MHKLNCTMLFSYLLLIGTGKKSGPDFFKKPGFFHKKIEPPTQNPIFLLPLK